MIGNHVRIELHYAGRHEECTFSITLSDPDSIVRQTLIEVDNVMTIVKLERHGNVFVTAHFHTAHTTHPLKTNIIPILPDIRIMLPGIKFRNA